MISSNGEVATNAHVVSDGPGTGRRADAVYVQFADGNQVPAKVVGTDPNRDVALLAAGSQGAAPASLMLPFGRPAMILQVGTGGGDRLSRSTNRRRSRSA